MALKRKITKAEFDALNPLLQAEYKADGADYVLDAEGFDDPVALKRAKEHEVEARKAVEAELKDLKTKLDTITDTDAKRKGDVAAIEKSWQDKLTKSEADHKTAMAGKDKFIEETLVDSVANSLASELAGESAIVLLPHIKARLTADLSGDKPLTRVLDQSGKPSASSVEDLKKEIAGDGRFKAVVIASRATGGGAAGGKGGGAAPSNKKFKELNDQERTEFFKRDPDGFKAAVEADRRVY